MTAPELPGRCPGGCPIAGRMTLLTSMTRYYTCESCARHWQVPRLDVRSLAGTSALGLTGVC